MNKEQEESPDYAAGVADGHGEVVAELAATIRAAEKLAQACIDSPGVAELTGLARDFLVELNQVPRWASG